MNPPSRELEQLDAIREHSKLRVLCAEDDEQLASMLRMALERDGHAVERVGDGVQALARITADVHYFDVLLTDHRMPQLSGLGLVSKLRDTAFSGAIIVHSSCLTDGEIAAYHALAVDHVLNKPVDLAELLALIRQMGESKP